MKTEKKDVPWGIIIQAVAGLVTAFINRPRKPKGAAPAAPINPPINTP